MKHATHFIREMCDMKDYQSECWLNICSKSKTIKVAVRPIRLTLMSQRGAC